MILGSHRKDHNPRLVWLAKILKALSVIVKLREGSFAALLLSAYMTGLLHEGIFHVQGLIKPANFEGSPWAYVMCNWAQILICWRHWSTEYRKWPFLVLGQIYGHSDLGHKFGHKFSISSHIMIQAVVNMIWGACNHHVTSPMVPCYPL